MFNKLFSLESFEETGEHNKFSGNLWRTPQVPRKLISEKINPREKLI